MVGGELRRVRVHDGIDGAATQAEERVETPEQSRGPLIDAPGVLRIGGEAGRSPVRDRDENPIYLLRGELGSRLSGGDSVDE
jgi:hypothetical protein